MGKKSPEFDAYISDAPPFARPILTRLRALFHRACPQIEEKLKWGHPSFEYKGIVGGVAAFKEHAVWGLWKSALLKDPHGAMTAAGDSAMSRDRLTDVSQLPPDHVILNLIEQAVDLNERGVKLPKAKPTKKRPPPKVPPDFAAALKKNSKAAVAFKEFSPSHQREYIEWITEAKQDATRQKRLAQAIEWIAQGKPRNWKYMRK
jgi:uncharacterized protein YdeI (YjbR/CyaY-like superfamily)